MADQKPSQARPEFFVEARRDKKASEEAGRPIFKDVEMVRVRFAGDASASSSLRRMRSSSSPPAAGTC